MNVVMKPSVSNMGSLYIHNSTVSFISLFLNYSLMIKSRTANALPKNSSTSW